MWLLNPSQVVAAIIVDLIVGDPHGWPHQARFAGLLATVYERWLTRHFSRSIRLGLLFWFLVVGTMMAGYVIVHIICSLISPIASYVFDVFIIYQAIAARDLHRHAKMVLRALVSGDLSTARKRLSYIVGRDTQDLDTSEISRATIESVSESLVDGIVAPLFWAVIGGAPAALIYRTANTLDSMVGHRTPAYEKFGKPAARIDDLLNWAPARLCALMLCLFRTPVSWRKVQREAGAHASPNAGWPEAAMAYALGVRLGGTNYYDGEAVEGPVFNASGRVAGVDDVRTSLTRIWWVVCAAGGMVLLVAAGFCREAAIDCSPGLQPWVCEIEIGALKVAPDVRNTGGINALCPERTRRSPLSGRFDASPNPGLKPWAVLYTPFRRKKRAKTTQS